MIRHLRVIIPLAVIILLGWQSILSLLQYFSTEPLPWMSTPHGLPLYPLGLNLPDSLYFLKPFTAEVSQNSQLWHAHWTYGLSPVVATVISYLVTSIFLYSFARVRKLEKAYLYLSFVIICEFLLLLDYLTMNRFNGLFFTIAYILNPAMIYMMRAVFGMVTRIRFHVMTVFGGLILFFLINLQSAEDELKMVEGIALTYLLTFFYSLWLIYRDTQGEFENSQIKKQRTRQLLALSLNLFLILPALILHSLIYVELSMNISYNLLYFLPTFIPAVFFTLSLRSGIVLFDTPVSVLAIRVVYFIFFSLLYWFTIGYQILFLSIFENNTFIHLALILAFLLLVDPFRTLAYSFLNRFFYARRNELTGYLKETAFHVNNPRQIETFFNRTTRILAEALQVRKVELVFSGEIFSGWDPDNDSVFFLDDDHPVWSVIEFWRKARSFPVFTQTAVGPVRDLLQKKGDFLLVALNKFKAAVIISEKKNNVPVSSEDVRFLKNVVRQLEPLLENYRFLLSTIQLKKREAELAYAAKIQRKLIPVELNEKNFSYKAIYRPSVQVTGDFIDLLQQSKGVYYLFLGDISGHGLGSAYLMAFVRTFIRGSITAAGSSLSETLERLNKYLCHNYSGSDFITLFAVRIEIRNDGTACLNYINAGQHPAYIYLRNERRLLELGHNQRLLGVVETGYSEKQLEMHGSARLFMFSDGAFEIFDHKGQMLGLERLKIWFRKTIRHEKEHQLMLFDKRLRKLQARQPDQPDDTSLIMADIL